MQKLVSALVISLAVLAMLLPVMNPVNLSISNSLDKGQVLTADGGPNPPPVPNPPVSLSMSNALDKEQVLRVDGGPNPPPVPNPPVSA